MRQAIIAAAVAATVGAESLRVANNPGRQTSGQCELRQLWGDGTPFSNRAAFIADQGKAFNDAQAAPASANGRRLQGGFVSAREMVCTHVVAPPGRPAM
jgi:hypothetical protein